MTTTTICTLRHQYPCFDKSRTDSPITHRPALIHTASLPYSSHELCKTPCIVQQFEKLPGTRLAPPPLPPPAPPRSQSASSADRMNVVIADCGSGASAVEAVSGVSGNPLQECYFPAESGTGGRLSAEQDQQSGDTGQIGIVVASTIFWLRLLRTIKFDKSESCGFCSYVMAATRRCSGPTTFRKSTLSLGGLPRTQKQKFSLLGIGPLSLSLSLGGLPRTQKRKFSCVLSSLEQVEILS